MDSQRLSKVHLPSGNLLHSYWKWLFIVDFPIKSGDFPYCSFLYVYQRVIGYPAISSIHFDWPWDAMSHAGVSGHWARLEDLWPFPLFLDFITSFFRLWMWKETFWTSMKPNLIMVNVLKSSTSIASNVWSLAYNNHMFTIPFHCLKSVPFSPKRPLRPGEIYSWGWGEFGQLGLGFSSSSFQAWLGMLGT